MKLSKKQIEAINDAPIFRFWGDYGKYVNLGNSGKNNYRLPTLKSLVKLDIFHVVDGSWGDEYHTTEKASQFLTENKQLTE